MVYELHYVGGPCDGEQELSPRPYDSVEFQGMVYSVKDEDESPEWVDDNTRRITLHYAEKGVEFPPVFSE
jgi:hypothetical protein